MQKTLKNLFENQLFLVFTLLSFYAYWNMTIGASTWDLNRSIGWGPSVIERFSIYSHILFPIIYGLLTFLNRKTNIILSITHIFLFASSIYLHPYYSTHWRYETVAVLVWVVFIANVVFSKSGK